jgi:hypothetical protein
LLGKLKKKKIVFLQGVFWDDVMMLRQKLWMVYNFYTLFGSMEEKWKRKGWREKGGKNRPFPCLVEGSEG